MGENSGKDGHCAQDCGMPRALKPQTNQASETKFELKYPLGRSPEAACKQELQAVVGPGFLNGDLHVLPFVVGVPASPQH